MPVKGVQGLAFLYASDALVLVVLASYYSR
jgi:hypothetical protein